MKRRLLGPVVLILVASCSNYNNPTMPGVPNPAPSSRPLAGRPTPCDTPGHQGQNGPGGAPFVCIDYQAFYNGTQPDPQHLVAWQADAVQFWFYNVPAGVSPQMSLEFAPETVARIVGGQPTCQAGHCTIVVLPNTTADTQARKYNVVDVTSGHRLDPDIFIEPVAP